MFNKFAVIMFVLIVSVSTKANHNTGALAIRSGKVTKLEIFDKLNVIGRCKHEQSRVYHSDVSGIIESVIPAENNKVKKGDLIIAIDQNLAESMYSRAKSLLKSAESAYSRDKILFDHKHLSKESLEKSELNLVKSRNEFEQAHKLYANMLIKAPFDGEIGVIKVKSGDKVKEGDFLFSIIGISNKSVFFAIPEIFQDKISKDTEILMLDSKGNKLKASIDSIANYISDHGTFDIKVTINGHNDIIHGSYIDGALIINKHFGLVIPELSVLKNDNGNFIYKIEKNNIIKQIYIKLGSRLGEYIELISDEIKEGDLVVTEGLTKVYEGATIMIIN